MYLKSLTLKGFKSFADRASIKLEPGVTVVVGPNGSGKSNISDAVLWVLGEQSAKSLRGQSMEDVIFAGSSAKQPVGVAEVDLVLENSAGELPLEFDEITVTRRMFRSGESEYLINRSPSRLMDILDLLSDSGLGRDTHTIISQGQLEEVLSSKPEERRALIEEAAGILKHKKRKERAVSKLGSMDAHLSRVRDIVSEIERQLRPLERQVSKATEHQDLSAQLRGLEVALAVEELRTLQAKWDAIGSREGEQNEAIELARYRLAEKQGELERFQGMLEEKGLFVGDLSEQRRRLQSVLERLNSGMLLLEEKGKNLIERISQLRQQIHHSETRIAQRTAEMERLAEERSASDKKLQELYGRLGELRREAEGAKKERLAAEEQLASTISAAKRVRKEIDDGREELAGIEQSLAALAFEKGMLQERDEALSAQRGTLLATLSGRRGRLQQLDESLSHTRKELKLSESDVDKRVRVLESRRKELETRREQLTETRAQLRGLEEVHRAFETASPALAWILQKERELPGIIGPMPDLMTMAAEHERLVEHVLGADLFCVLLKDRASQREVLRMLAENDAGDVSLLALDDLRVPERPSPDAGERLVDLVRCSDECMNALESLLGDVYVVGTLEQARAAAKRNPGVRFATTDGYVVWPSGKVSVAPAADTSAGVLARKRRINELNDDEDALLDEMAAAEAEVASAQEALGAAQQDALELGQRLAAVAGEAESIRDEVGRLETELTGMDAEVVRVTKRLAEIDDKTARDAPTKDTVRAAIVDASSRLEELERLAAEKSESRDALFRDEAGTSGKLGECQVDIAGVSEREVFLKRQYASFTSEIDELTGALEQSRQVEQALEVLRSRIQPVHDLYSALLQRAEHWAGKLRDRARFEQADSDSLRDQIHAVQEAVRTAQSELDELTAEIGGTHVEKGQLEVQVETAVTRIVEDLETPLERALQGERVEDRAAAEERMLKLRRKISNLGPVNPMALQEHGDLRERRDFLEAQVRDLQASRAALQKVIKAIDRKMRERFTETFEEVDGHFQHVFQVLFPGGHAQLKLTEPDDPEATGVEVIAQPLGKKLSKMSLMSGGEKSLVALALLFALYRTRPCPFYILDEVEAALDDVNLRRFIAFVDSMRKHTQFIIVTHQRRTMEMADLLYGVSMQADGVSKVVSQKMERAQAAAEESA